MKYNLILLLIFSFSYSQNKDKNQNEIIKEIFGQKCYVKDTISEIVISHEECTECIDAYLNSGKLYISENIFNQIKEQEQLTLKKNLALL